MKTSYGFTLYISVHWVLSVYESCGASLFFLATYTIFNKRNHMGKRNHKTVCKKVWSEIRQRLSKWGHVSTLFEFMCQPGFVANFLTTGTPLPVAGFTRDLQGVLNSTKQAVPPPAPPPSAPLHAPFSLEPLVLPINKELWLSSLSLTNPKVKYLSNEDLHPVESDRENRIDALLNSARIPGHILERRNTTDGLLMSSLQACQRYNQDADFDTA